jgi:hypothetical protein
MAFSGTALLYFYILHGFHFLKSKWTFVPTSVSTLDCNTQNIEFAALSECLFVMPRLCYDSIFPKCWEHVTCSLHCVTNYVAPEHEGLLPYSQEPTTGPYPELTGSNLHPPANLPKIQSDPIYASVFKVVSFFLAIPSKPCTHSSPMHATRPAHIFLLDLICLIMFGKDYKIWTSSLCNFPPYSCYFIPLRSEYS